MKTYTCVNTGQSITLVKEIANSGEGEVWETNRNGYLAKIYHSPSQERMQKLQVMLANPPTDHNSYLNHISFAWPKSLLKDSNGNFVGFLMPAITGGKEIIDIYNPQRRQKLKLEIDWRFLHTTALNIASIIQAIHTESYVLGDIKPQNILVNNRALPSIIDTDSFQVYHPITNQVYHCEVGSSGFTPPEIIGKNFSNINQTEVHDRFRLAVIIYHLLFGKSPFAGNWIGTGETPDIDELIKKGFWLYGANSWIKPVDTTIPLDIVHPEIKRCFIKCFNDGYTNPNLRPSAAVWVKVLKLAIDKLSICGRVDSHYFSRTYEKCYWCDRAKNLGVDIFPTISKSIPQVVGAGVVVSTSSNQQQEPNSAEAYSTRGNVYYNKGDYDLAIADYNKAIRLNPKLAYAYSQRGNAYYNKGDYHLAIADYNQAIQLDPKLANAYNVRGIIYDKKGDYDRAFADYNQAIKLEPNLASAYIGRGIIYNEKGDYDRAFTDYNQAIKLDPKLAYAYKGRGDVYCIKRDYDLAIADYNEAIQLDPKLAYAYSNRGSVYETKGDYDRAIADYNQAIQLDPNLKYVYVNKDNALKKKGKNNTTTLNQNHAVQANPKSASAAEPTKVNGFISVIFGILYCGLIFLIGNMISIFLMRIFIK